MSTLTFEDFRDGLDRKKSEQVNNDRGFQTLDNAYVNAGYAVVKRPGMENLHGATALDTALHGLFMFDQKLMMVTHAAGFVAPPALSGYGIAPPISATVQVLVCQNPLDATDTISRVWQIVPFNRKLYVVVEYTSGVIRHFYGSVAELIATVPLHAPNGS